MAKNSAILTPTNKELTPKDFSHLLGMEGFSDRMLTIHFQLYEAYVKNANALMKKWEEYRAKGDYSEPAFGESKRRFGWEYNSVKLHELYFGNLGKTKGDNSSPPAVFESAVSEQFGSFDKWKEEFLGVAATRGIGWVILYRDKSNQKLINAWIDEHNNGHLIQSEPIVVLDVFEHAFMIDYGVDKKTYLKAFMKNIQWDVIENRVSEGK